ncbi:hypothetical protein KJ641_00455, partial [Patescibacteria group bacterium]|nr:hypothetical protein [Patescibacteria group bacterium]
MFARKPVWCTKNEVKKTNERPSFVFWVLCVILFVSLFGSILLFGKNNVVDTASAPTIIGYQAKLLESSAAVTTTKAMAFLLYDSLTGGTLLYTASGTLGSTTTVNVTPSNGVFTISLGDTAGTPASNAVSPSIFQNNTNVYLEVIVEGTVMSPRKQLTSVPFAFNSEYLSGVSATSTASTSTYIPISGSDGSFVFNTTTIYKLLDVEGKVGSPVHAGSISSVALDGARSVFVSGDYAYVLAKGDNDGMQIIDISDPSNPTGKGSILNGEGGALLDTPTSVFVSGNYAYVVGTGNDALEIIDISNSADPTHKGSLVNGVGGALLVDAYSVFVSGNYAYVACFNSNALEIIDISDPANPTHKGSIVHGAGGAKLETPKSVFVSGNYAYVVSETSVALEIIDISDPANPTHKGSIVHGAGGASLEEPNDVFVYGNYAYVASGGSHALEIIDISDPANPTHAGKIFTGAGGALLSGPYSVFVSGNYAYVASHNSDALEIVDISSSTNPVHKSSIADGVGGALLNDPTSVFVSGNYTYVVSETSDALEIIDISGTTISNAEIGTAKIDNLQVMSHAIFDQGLNIRGGLGVGSAGLLLSGDFGMSAPTSTNVTTATNTLRFSHTALFKSSATSTDSNVFIFDTANTLANGNLLSVRNNGSEKFVIDQSGKVGIGTIVPSTTLHIIDTSEQLRLGYDASNYASFTVSSTSALQIQNSSDSITSFQILDADGGLPIFNVDTTNERVGIGTASPRGTFD